jgi:hypothetical protein
MASGCFAAARGLLSRPVAFGFKLVRELIELVEIDAGPEAERAGYRSHRAAPGGPGLFAEAGAKRPIHHLLERQPEFTRALLEETGQIVVDGERCAHADIISAS